MIIAARSATKVLDKKHLHQCTVIAFPVGCSYRRIIEEWFAGLGISPNRVLELASYHAIVASVALGITVKFP